MDPLDDAGVSYAPVSSSNVHSVGYRVETRTLFVRFLDKPGGDWGSIYAYLGVPSHVYLDLLRADSKGTHLNRAVKGKYPHRRLA